MENKSILTIIAVVVIIEIILAGAVIYAMSDHGEQEGYTLYVGLNDSVTHEDYDPDEAAAWVDEIVLKYVGGLTRYNANGAYTYDDGTIICEKTLVYYLTDVSLEDVHKICDEVKELLNQSSILISIGKQKSEFY
ncbi:MAG: hypothetical protein J5920_03875 [Candidatus Methanomethylophilaceae archaeon]|nr:hypothetical protein [Candidatus Methanomethylophilaceae archaeon]